MKKSLTILFLCAVLSALAGCGSGETQVVPEETLPPETVAAPVETQPEVDPFAEDDLLAERELIYDLQAAFDMALGYVVDSETLTPAERISNAILNTTSYEILSAADGLCQVKVTFPDAYKSFQSTIASLPEDASEQEIKVVMESFALSVEQMEIPMNERVFDATYVMDESIAVLQWTDPLINAFSGGFYNAFNAGIG